MTDSAPPAAVLPERLTLAEADVTLRRLLASVSALPGAVVPVDASPLQQFDSSAVAVLLELGRHLQGQGSRLQVVGLPPRLRDLLALYGVESLLPA